jgi:hypothetical protein
MLTRVAARSDLPASGERGDSAAQRCVRPVALTLRYKRLQAGEGTKTESIIGGRVLKWLRLPGDHLSCGTSCGGPGSCPTSGVPAPLRCQRSRAFDSKPSIRSYVMETRGLYHSAGRFVGLRNVKPMNRPAWRDRRKNFRSDGICPRRSTTWAGTWSVPASWSTSRMAARRLRGSEPTRSPMSSGCARPSATVDHAGSSGVPRIRWASRSLTFSMARTVHPTRPRCGSRPTAKSCARRRRHPTGVALAWKLDEVV